MYLTELELYDFFKDNTHLNSQEITDLFLKKYPEYSGEDTSLLYRRMIRIKEKVKKSQKIKTKKLSDSKIKIFPSKTKQSIDSLPGSSDDSAEQTKIADPVPDSQSVSTEYIAELHQIIETLKLENIEVKKQCISLAENAQKSLREYDNVVSDLQALARHAEQNYDEILMADQSKINDYKKELKDIETRYTETQEKLEKAERYVKKYCTKRVNQREERQEERIVKLKNKLKQQKEKLDGEFKVKLKNQKTEKLEELKHLEAEVETLENERDQLLRQYNDEKERAAELCKTKEAYQKKCSDLKGRLRKKDELMKAQKDENEEEIDRQWLRI